MGEAGGSAAGWGSRGRHSSRRSLRTATKQVEIHHAFDSPDRNANYDSLVFLESQLIQDFWRGKRAGTRAVGTSLKPPPIGTPQVKSGDMAGVMIRDGLGPRE